MNLTLHVSGPAIGNVFGAMAIDPDLMNSCLVVSTENAIERRPVVTGWKRGSNAASVTPSVAMAYASERRH